MKLETAIQKLRDTVRLRHLAISTEQSYIGWLTRFSRFVIERFQDGKPEEKMEAFLTQLAWQEASK